MTTKQPTPPPLTLFDAAAFEYATEHDAKTPSRPSPAGLCAVGLAAARPVSTSIVRSGVSHQVARDAQTTQARRRRARARMAKRRYLADTEGYERIEQARRALHLVAD